MGFESKFTLYRKYNTKVSENDFQLIVKKYVDENKRYDYSSSKKTDDEYAKYLPAVLNLQLDESTNKYDEASGKWVDKADHSVAEQRKTFNYVLASDRSDLDELLYWHFGSEFSCLANEFSLGHYMHGNEVVIDSNTAEKMLQACNYLLLRKWSDDIEDMLDNKWIKVFAEGNTSDSYWPYTYRNDKAMLKKVSAEEQDNLKYTIVQTKQALEAYLKSETSGKYENGTELILVYSISY